jgi:hypothetical protein
MTSGFESSGVKVENRHMALVSRVSQEIYELVRPILWRVRPSILVTRSRLMIGIRSASGSEMGSN